MSFFVVVWVGLFLNKVWELFLLHSFFLGECALGFLFECMIRFLAQSSQFVFSYNVLPWGSKYPLRRYLTS